jgi:hypothetical protein
MDDRFRMPLQLPTFRGKLDIVPCPAEKVYAQGLFQLADTGAYGCLGDAKFICGPAEVAGAYHGKKSTQQFDIHAGLPVDKIF